MLLRSGRTSGYEKHQKEDGEKLRGKRHGSFCLKDILRRVEDIGDDGK
jgi:hypothetical protein